MKVMNVKQLCILAGVAWGTLLGIAGAAYAAAFASGVAWLFLFGDSPWPAWSEPAILAVAVATGLAILFGCSTVGWAAGRRCEYARPAARGRARVLAGGALMLALLAGAAGAWSIARQQVNISIRRTEDRQSAEALDELRDAVHRFSAVEVDWPGGGGDGSATLHLDGRRTGGYRLEWEIRPHSFGKAVLSGSRRLTLDPGPAELELPIRARALVDGYRALLSRQDANVMVDEPFVLEAKLIPVLDDTEVAVLPEGEAGILAQGRSALIDESSAEFPVRFFLYGGELSWRAR